MPQSLSATPAVSAASLTSKNYERFRKLNFALRALTEPLSIETVVAALRQYDTDDAMFGHSEPNTRRRLIGIVARSHPASL